MTFRLWASGGYSKPTTGERDAGPEIWQARRGILRSQVCHSLFEARATAQPQDRRPQVGVVSGEATAEIARWAQLAAIAGPALLYQESSMVRRPVNAVVLGDLAHEALGLPVAFENAPNSLREVEAATTFRGRT